MDAKKTARIVLILSLIGVIDAAFSTYEHYALLSGAEDSSFCDLGSGISCSAVNGSAFSEIFGVPTAAMGVLWFIATIFIAGQMTAKKKFLKNPEFYLFAWSIVGLITVFWLLYAEYVIGAICLLCTLVHLIVVATLILSYKSLKKSPLRYLEDIFYK